MPERINGARAAHENPSCHPRATRRTMHRQRHGGHGGRGRAHSSLPCCHPPCACCAPPLYPHTKLRPPSSPSLFPSFDAAVLPCHRCLSLSSAALAAAAGDSKREAGSPPSRSRFAAPSPSSLPLDPRPADSSLHFSSRGFASILQMSQQAPVLFPPPSLPLILPIHLHMLPPRPCPLFTHDRLPHLCNVVLMSKLCW